MSLVVLTDEQLVFETGKGGMSALAELVKRHQQRALSLAYRSLGDWQLAEDVVQEGFLRVHRAAPRYKPEAKFSTWFYRIIVNLCMDELRRHQRRTGLAAETPQQTASVGENPVQHQEILELRLAVKQALNHLNERERMAVVLHRFEGLAHNQIAEIMQASASAIESLLVRAYRKLRGELAHWAEGHPKKTQAPAPTDV